MLPKHVRSFGRILAIYALFSCMPAMAHGKNGWQLDPLGSQSYSNDPDAQQICELLLRMLDNWNAHEL
jgi:hypothetical protein